MEAFWTISFKIEGKVREQFCFHATSQIRRDEVTAISVVFKCDEMSQPLLSLLEIIFEFWLWRKLP